MKIMEIIPSLNNVGGAETLFVNLCSKIVKRQNIQLVIVVLYKATDDTLKKMLPSGNCAFYNLNKHKGIDFRCATQLSKIINKEKPDVVHCHLSSTLTLFLSLLFKKKPKVYYTLHNMVGDGFRNEKFNQFLCRIKFMNVVGVGKTVAQSFTSATGIEIPYVENGVDIKLYNPYRPVEDRKIDLLCVGTFSDVKNQEFILRSLHLIREQKFNCYFLGNGDNFEKCKRICSSLGLDNCVSFEGRVNDVHRYMSDSKILVIGSISEANPMVINEALCSGMFVVATNVGGIKDIINENNGILITGFHEDEYSKALLEVMSNKQQLEEKRIKNLMDVYKYSIECCVDKYLKIFSKN